MSQTLPISRLIRVSVNLTPQAAQAQDLQTLLILGSSNVIDVVERIRSYSSISQVAEDFGTTAPEYLAAVLWFEQNPQPFLLKIGRWAETATQGKLVCAPLSNTNRLIATWNAITNGGFSVTVDGTPQNLGSLNFSAASNLNGIASIINGALSGCVVTYNATAGRFEFQSATSGPSSTVSFLTTNTGTDISAMLNGRSGSGAYVADGIAAESPVTCVTIFDERFGQTWYGVTFADTSLTNDQIVACLDYIQASNNKHLFGVSTQDANVLAGASTTDIAYVLSAANYSRAMVQYSSSNPYSVASLMGRALTVDYNGNNTTITLMYKQEPGITAESLTETQADVLAAKKANAFVAYNNDTAIIQNGVMSSGDYIDELTDTDWLAIDIMTGMYNLLYTSPTKIPQTDAGSNILVATAAASCSRGVNNGMIAPGVWNSQGFGTLKQGDFIPTGFYIYAPPVANQSVADRAARKSVPIQIAIKLAGAVHEVIVAINVNR